LKPNTHTDECHGRKPGATSTGLRSPEHSSSDARHGPFDVMSTGYRPRAFPPTLLINKWKPLARIAGAVAACAVLVGLSAELIDRPMATWVHEHLGDARFDWFTAYYGGNPLAVGPFSLMASPAQALGPLAVLVIAMLAIATAIGRRPRMRGRIILALAVSVFAAGKINALAKWVFGQTWPESWLGNNPSWIRDGGVRATSKIVRET
jgi:hypothetical protein